jgi:hypothetical protein
VAGKAKNHEDSGLWAEGVTIGARTIAIGERERGARECGARREVPSCSRRRPVGCNVEPALFMAATTLFPSLSVLLVLLLTMSLVLGGS